MRVTPIPGLKFGLKDLGVLGEGPDPDFDAAVILAQRSTGSPIATFATADFEMRRSRLRAWTGLGSHEPKPRAIPLEASLVFRAAASAPELIVVPDTARDAQMAALPFVRSHGIRSLLAAPVLCPADHIVALLTVHDTMPRIWSGEERSAIAHAAHFCTQVILLRAALRTLRLISTDSVRTGAAR